MAAPPCWVVDAGPSVSFLITVIQDLAESLHLPPSEVRDRKILRKKKAHHPTLLKAM